MKDRRKKVLVLGGTGEARAIVEGMRDVYGDKLTLVYSLAGVTRSPEVPEGVEVMTGGFGGKEGFEAYIREAEVSAVINATHPFAATMTRNAYDVSNSLGVPLLRVEREVWEPEEGDEWSEVQDVESASFYVPRFGKRCMLALGGRHIHLFSKWTRVFFLVRLVELPDGGVLPLESYAMRVDKDVLSVEEEKGLMEEHEIDVLVVRNSGGATTASKLLAAREKGISVIMLQRPPSLGGDTAQNFEELKEWCAGII
jgi:precorrin-6A/cobalt-precorrin-6A reductase